MNPYEDPSLKVLKKVPVDINSEAHILGPEPTNPINILIVDVETTGLNHLYDEVIEIAGVMMTACRDTAEVHKIEPIFDYFREPKTKSISAEITKLTSIRPEDVKGQDINKGVIYKTFANADLVVAHNGQFDRPFVENLLPDLLDDPKPWACSCWDPDWSDFSARKLKTLVEESGHWFDAHRAGNDCCATAYLLHLYPKALKTIIEWGTKDIFKLTYTGTPFDSNVGLKARSFGFKNKSWSKSYTDMNALIKDRNELTEYFKTFPNAFARLVCKSTKIAPSNRFSIES